MASKKLKPLLQGIMQIIPLLLLVKNTNNGENKNKNERSEWTFIFAVASFPWDHANNPLLLLVKNTNIGNKKLKPTLQGIMPIIPFIVGENKQHRIATGYFM